MEMTYTYQGVRRREGRDEAVIALEGTLRGGRGIEEKLGGKAHGSAVVDLATGQISSAEATVTIEATIKLPESETSKDTKDSKDPKDPKDPQDSKDSKEMKVTGSLNVKLQREVH